MKCDFCGQAGITTGAIMEGKFGQACNACRSTQDRQASPASAEYSRERDREVHKKDMLQARDHKGNVNIEFLKAYPEQADKWYSKEEINKAKKDI